MVDLEQHFSSHSGKNLFGILVELDDYFYPDKSIDMLLDEFSSCVIAQNYGMFTHYSSDRFQYELTPEMLKDLGLEPDQLAASVRFLLVFH